MAALTVKFQFRMTEDEQKMLREVAEEVYPETNKAQSLLMRKMIREAYARQQRRQEEQKR